MEMTSFAVRKTCKADVNTSVAFENKETNLTPKNSANYFSNCW
jgi:hypothetical protein